MELFKPGLCFSCRISFGGVGEIGQNGAESLRMYSEIAWRGQSEQRREGADGCKMQQELAAFQHEDKCAGFPSGVVFSRVFWWVMREVR